MSLSNDYIDFVNYVGSGLTLQAHSGEFGQDEITVYTVRDYYEHDEIMCENDFMDNFSCLDVSVEDILSGVVDVETYEFNQVYNSFVNGQFKQFQSQFEELEDLEGFLDWIESTIADDEEITRIYRAIINFNY